MFLGILKSLLCKHDYRVVKTLDGKQVYHFDAISEWKCAKCNQVTYSRYMDKLK